MGLSAGIMKQTRLGFYVIGTYGPEEVVVKIMSSPINAVLELAHSDSRSQL